MWTRQLFAFQAAFQSDVTGQDVLGSPLGNGLSVEPILEKETTSGNRSFFFVVSGQGAERSWL